MKIQTMAVSAALLLGCGGGDEGPAFPELKAVAGECSASWSVAARPLGKVADANGDGVADLLVAAEDGAARVELRSGSDGKRLWSRELSRSAAAATLEDLDGDGAAELLVTTVITPEQACEGDSCSGDQSAVPEYFLEALNAGDGATRWSRSPQTARPNENSRFAVLDDENGDGVRELLLSAPYSHELEPAALQVVSGATGAVLRVLEPMPNAAESLGSALIALPDLDGDGRTDMLISDPRGPYDRYAKGRVVAASSATGAVLWERSGDAVEGALLYGEGLNLLARPDGAYPDVLAGAHNADALDTEPQPGVAEVLDGRTGARRFLLTGRRGNEHFGLELVDVGDLNGDGVADVGVGAPMPGVPVAMMGEGGRFAVHSGVDGALLVDLEEKVGNDQTSNLFGIRLFGLGDRGEDGRSTLITESSEKDGSTRAPRTYAFRCTSEAS